MPEKRRTGHRRAKTRRFPAATLARLLTMITAADVPPIVREVLALHPSQFIELQRAYRVLKTTENALLLTWDGVGVKRRAGKLTDEQVAEVVKLHAENPTAWSQRRLADKFGVSAPAIARALRRSK